MKIKNKLKIKEHLSPSVECTEESKAYTLFSEILVCTATFEVRDCDVFNKTAEHPLGGAIALPMRFQNYSASQDAASVFVPFH